PWMLIVLTLLWAISAFMLLATFPPLLLVVWSREHRVQPLESGQERMRAAAGTFTWTLVLIGVLGLLGVFSEGAAMAPVVVPSFAALIVVRLLPSVSPQGERGGDRGSGDPRH
ncbi:MAG: hypothetical protein ACRD9W_07505, partial [Terriglobia bacterium]